MSKKEDRKTFLAAAYKTVKGGHYRMEKTKHLLGTDAYLKEPKMYAVIIHNDDYTTMDFVIELLVKIFHKTQHEAADIMLSVHEGGKGVAGIYTYDIAQTKKLQAEQSSNEKGFPLKITLDEAIE